MKSFKKFIPTLAILLFSATLILAQTAEAPAAAEYPSWMVNPIGSIIGLVLMVLMFVGMAKAALSKD